METPGATAKIPNVSAYVGPIDEEGHNAGDADFVEAPTATTFLAFAGSSNCAPVFPGAMNASDHGTSRAHKSKSADRAV